MDQRILVLSYLLMTLFQVYHKFEEIGGRAYKLVGSLKKYLIAASVLVTLNVVSLSLIILDLQVGYIVGIVGAAISVLNGVVHLVGYVKTRSFYESIGAGVFTGIPLGIAGVVVLYQLMQGIT
jgi:hypothetical protein